MPKVTVYIRTDDYDRWKAVEKKTEFIHDALHGTVLNLKGRVIKEIRTAPIDRQGGFSHPKQPLQANPKSHTYIDKDMLP